MKVYNLDMSKTKIKNHLSKDTTLKPIIASITFDWQKDLASNDIYLDLLKSIMSQQLSVKAANTIIDRFIQIFPKKYPTPKKLIQMTTDDLRKVGLSRQKANYVINVAQFFIAEKAFKKDWSSMTDEEIINYLTQIKGVGKWTSQMILIFSLNRPDVFPENDLGVVESMRSIYDLNLDKKALKAECISIAKNWSPYRSYGARFMWAWRDAD